MESGQNFEIIEYENGIKHNACTCVPREVPFTIFVNETEFATISCSPMDLKEYVYGFLLSSGMIASVTDVTDCFIDNAMWTSYVTTKRLIPSDMLLKRVYTSGCGKGILFSGAGDLIVKHPLDNSYYAEDSVVRSLISALQTGSKSSNSLRGMHSATAFSDSIPIDLHMHDIGRHNAVDKIIGRLALSEIDFDRCILACTGRASSEIIIKSRRVGIPIVATFGVPTNQAVLIAKSAAITLIHRTSHNSYRVYSCPERIV